MANSKINFIKRIIKSNEDSIKARQRRIMKLQEVRGGKTKPIQSQKQEVVILYLLIQKENIQEQSANNLYRKDNFLQEIKLQNGNLGLILIPHDF